MADSIYYIKKLMIECVELGTYENRPVPLNFSKTFDRRKRRLFFDDFFRIFSAVMVVRRCLSVRRL